MESGEISGVVVLGILEEVVLSCWDGFQVNEGDSRMILGMEGRGRMLGFWVSLGDELEEISMELEGLDCWKGRGGRTLIFCKGRGGELEALTLSLDALSQGGQRWLRRGIGAGFIRGTKELGTLWILKSHRCRTLVLK